MQTDFDLIVQNLEFKVHLVFFPFLTFQMEDVLEKKEKYVSNLMSRVEYMEVTQNEMMSLLEKYDYELHNYKVYFKCDQLPYYPVKYA